MLFRHVLNSYSPSRLADRMELLLAWPSISIKNTAHPSVSVYSAILLKQYSGRTCVDTLNFSLPIQFNHFCSRIIVFSLQQNKNANEETFCDFYRILISIIDVTRREQRKFSVKFNLLSISIEFDGHIYSKHFNGTG